MTPITERLRLAAQKRARQAERAARSMGGQNHSSGQGGGAGNRSAEATA